MIAMISLSVACIAFVLALFSIFRTIDLEEDGDA